jgi:hypothetical protein
LLAVMAAVPEFGRALLKPLGAQAGRVETFIEVPFKLGEKAVRPDGVITVTRAGKTWGALVEAKTAANPLLPEQINMYLDLARELGFEAVLSISNQYVTAGTEYPIEVDRRKLRRVSLHHWSWIDVLTEAIVQKEHRGVSDPDQAYILGELIRYLSDGRSGAVAFEGMGSSWTAVRDGAREGTLRRSDPAVAAVAARWDDLIRFVALTFTSELGHEVRQVLQSNERTPDARRHALVESLSSNGTLYAELRVPDAAGPLVVTADLRARQVTVSTSLDAPRQGTARGRVSWLLRQLQQAPDATVIEAKTGRRDAPAAPLRATREDPSLLYPDKGEIRAFRLALSTNMGTKRDNSRGSFAASIIDTAQAFYADLLQNIRAWKASPPKLKRPTEEEAVEEVAKIVGVEPEQVHEQVAEDVAPRETAYIEGGSGDDVPAVAVDESPDRGD